MKIKELKFAWGPPFSLQLLTILILTEKLAYFSHSELRKTELQTTFWFGHTAVAYKIEDDFFKGWNCLEFAPLYE